jgi:MoaA/NifB/PqqE/SkfB family radical SAM enzyme
MSIELAPSRTTPRQSWRDTSRYISIAAEFRCNLHCRHCMIDAAKHALQPRGEETFARIVAINAAEHRWSGLILTGAEITLHKGLADMARRARDGGFSHVRIQTHGMHLANAAYVDELIDAGIDEFFISICGPDADTHDRITGMPGSFRRLMRGLENLERHHVLVITNTVITTQSVAGLPAVVGLLEPFRRVRQMEFWNYFAMAGEDTRDLIVRFADLRGPLHAAVARALELGRQVEVKNVPQCLMGRYGDLLVNDQPLLEIDEAFWDSFAANGFHQCPHRPGCEARDCLGVNAAYVRKFGWDADLLSPQNKRWMS